MLTIVHIPKPLLDAIDRRARGLRISREKLILNALSRELKQHSQWSPGFFDRVRATDATTADAVDEMMAAIHAGRRSKKPRQL